MADTKAKPQVNTVYLPGSELHQPVRKHGLVLVQAARCFCRSFCRSLLQHLQTHKFSRKNASMLSAQAHMLAQITARACANTVPSLVAACALPSDGVVVGMVCRCLR